MGLLEDIEQCAASLASNTQRMLVGTENVQKYKAQLEELLKLDEELEAMVDDQWDHGKAKLASLLDVGKDAWRGKRREQTDGILRVNYREAMDKYQRSYIKTNQQAIQRRISELRILIEEEEGLLNKLTAQNDELKKTKTALEKENAAAKK